MAWVISVYLLAGIGLAVGLPYWNNFFRMALSWLFPLHAALYALRPLWKKLWRYLITKDGRY